MRSMIVSILAVGLLISNYTNAADYQTAQKLKDGDLISADVLNDILERIELSLAPIKAQELDGEWVITQYRCDRSGSDCAGNLPEKSTYSWDESFSIPPDHSDYTDSYSNFSPGVRSFNLSISPVGQNKFQFNDSRSVMVNYNNIFSDYTGPWTCRILSGASIYCNKDNDKSIVSMMDIQRSSATQFKLTYESGASQFNTLILNKVQATPNGPTLLASSALDGVNRLTWQDNSENESEFVVKRKESIDGVYEEIATTGENVTTYDDTSVAQGVTYWYRVGARNESGESLYSNAVRQPAN